MTRQFGNQWPEPLREQFTRISKGSYYSVLGEQDRPLDAHLASVFAIDMLLNAGAVTPPQVAPTAVDYSNEAWWSRTVPPFSPGNAEDIRDRVRPRLVLLTATPTERDVVLKFLSPVEGESRVLQVFEGKNTLFVGRIGAFPVVLCKCAMGASGRDAAQTVTGELIRFWRPAGVIMVGIAFGRDPAKQKFGDVLISERIIAYEPERVGVDDSVPRGQHFPSGALLLDRFQNACVHWRFTAPSGAPCTPRPGAILSGEKLVDQPKLKDKLFRQHPHAIGGEMEGVGVASAASRENCEWILVKGICDWADGTKSDGHQAFAATAAVSLVEHVLSHPGILPT